jgi:hypothetical protein
MNASGSGFASGNSEGGRLRKETRKLATCSTNISVQNGCLCVNKNTIQAPITPTQGSRIASLQYACDFASGVSSYGVSQGRVQQILAKKSLTNFVTEGTRIASLEKQINECNSTMFHVPLIPILCPPLPPPPAPPARACPLTKNQKMS